MSIVKKENEIPLAREIKEENHEETKSSSESNSEEDSDSEEESELGKKSQVPEYLNVANIEDEKDLVSTMKKDLLYVCIFTTDWCPGCKKLKEYLNKSYSEYKQLTKFIYINCDIYSELSKNLDILKIPDTRIYRNGKHIANFIGSNIQKFSKIVKDNER